MSGKGPRPTARRYVRGPHLILRAGVYYARTPEHPKGKSLQTRDPLEAERRFRALLAKPTEDVRRSTAPEQTIYDLICAWTAHPHGWTRRTRQSSRCRLIAAGAWFELHGAHLPSEITHALVAAWLTARGDEVSRRTINRDLRVLRRCLRWGATRGLCAVVPAVDGQGDLREPRRTAVRHLPDDAEVARVLDVVDPGAALALRALYATGLRIEELRRVTVGDLRDGALHVGPQAGTAASAEPGKSYRERVIPLHADALALVLAYLGWRAGTGGKGKAVGCSESWLLRKLHVACDKARVVRFGLHDLRAAFATHAHERGIPLRVIQVWLGHADVQTTERYLRPRRSDGAIVAPVPPAVDSVRIPGVISGRLQAHPFSASTHETQGISAPPGRVELPANGLGNRAKRPRRG